MRLILTGGGTGGHIYPALALAQYIKKVNPGAEILFVGARGGMEEKLIPGAGFRLQTLNVRGFPRRLPPRLFSAVYLLASSCFQAGKIVDQVDPHFVMGTGGYAAAPVMLAALKKNKKVIIHEQNVVPGLTNRFLAPWVYRVCLSFEGSRRYFIRRSNLFVTGNPRASLMDRVDKTTARRALNMDTELPLLLAVSGSRGAAKVNESMVEFLLRSSGNKNLQVLYITGESYYEKVVFRLQEGKCFEQFGGRLCVRPYQQEMPLAMAAADLIITRAGATTIAEITAIGLPAIIIPSPNVVHNHQFINARELAGKGAAVLLEETVLDGRMLQQAVYELLGSPSRLAEMKENSKKLGNTGAAENIYKLMFPPS